MATTTFPKRSFRWHYVFSKSLSVDTETMAASSLNANHSLILALLNMTNFKKNTSEGNVTRATAQRRLSSMPRTQVRWLQEPRRAHGALVLVSEGAHETPHSTHIQHTNLQVRWVRESAGAVTCGVVRVKRGAHYNTGHSPHTYLQPHRQTGSVARGARWLCARRHTRPGGGRAADALRDRRGPGGLLCTSRRMHASARGDVAANSQRVRGKHLLWPTSGPPSCHSTVCQFNEEETITFLSTSAPCLVLVQFRFALVLGPIGSKNGRNGRMMRCTVLSN